MTQSPLGAGALTGSRLINHYYFLITTNHTLRITNQHQMQGCLFSILWVEPYPEEFTFRDNLQQDWFFCGRIFFFK